jgi:hypothetical protein
LSGGGGPAARLRSGGQGGGFGSTPNDNAARTCAQAVMAAESCIQALTFRPSDRPGLADSIAASRASSVAVSRASAIAWPGAIRSMPSSSALTRSWAKADKVAIALALRLKLGSCSSSQASSGSQGAAGRPNWPSQLAASCISALIDRDALSCALSCSSGSCAIVDLHRHTIAISRPIHHPPEHRADRGAG